jgi:hypothetical protein
MVPVGNQIVLCWALFRLIRYTGGCELDLAVVEKACWKVAGSGLLL